jgi:SAM-dependent methyltransferase
MDRWRAKWLMRRAFGRTAAGSRLYWWLTAGVLGTRRGMAAKWCQWFREHVVLGRRHGDLSTDDAGIWVIDPGFTATPALLCRLLSEGSILLTDRWHRLRAKYNRLALSVVRERFPDMARWVKRDESRLVVLEGLPADDLPALLQRIGASYLAPVDPAAVDAPSASTDLCLSMGALEHYAPPALRALVAEMARVVRPGGITSHIVDHRDHLWHADPTKDCFHHLRFPDRFWQRIEHNPLLYTNRLLRSDYVEMLTEAGFEVRYAGYGLHESDAADIAPELLWGRYREASDEDLRAAVSHFLAVRR